MHWLATGMAIVLALAIIAIGTLYLARPRVATGSFGLPLPEAGANIAWWLRLKGVRDIVSGLAVLAMLTWVGPRAVGILLLVEALTAVGDMSLVLAARGSVKTAFGVHGVTAAVTVLTAIALILEVR